MLVGTKYIECILNEYKVGPNAIGRMFGISGSYCCEQLRQLGFSFTGRTSKAETERFEAAYGLSGEKPAMETAADKKTWDSSVFTGLWCLPQHSVDMLLTDPPYGTTQNIWDTPLPLPELWEAVRWAVKPNGAVLLFAQCPYDKVLGTSNLKMLRYEWVWCKPNGTGFLNAHRAPLKKTENILVFSEKAPAYYPQFGFGEPYIRVHKNSGQSANYGKFKRTYAEYDGQRFPCNILYFPRDPHGIHPTQKPVALCEYLIRTYTQPGELVADICAGSGTTAIAALRAGRSFICFEKNPQFYASAMERICKTMDGLEKRTSI